MAEVINCPDCKSVIQPEWYFCPICGKEIREAPVHLTLSKQLLIYSVSFFLAPFGLGWGMKYIRNPDKKVRIVGAISLFLTVLAIVLLIAGFKYTMDQYTQVLNSLSPGTMR